MKKVALILASLLAIMLAGCGEGSSSTGVTSANDDTTAGVVSPIVDTSAAEVTTPSTPYNLSANLGTPPSLPN